MSTLSSVLRSQKLSIEPNSTYSPDGDNTSPNKEQASDSAGFISNLKQFSIDKRRYKNFGTLMTSQDLEKIIQGTKSETLNNIEQVPGNSFKGHNSPKFEGSNEKDSKFAEVKTPKQKSISVSTPATSLLSPLASINTSISTDKTEGRPQFGEGMMGDIMQLKIEQEKTKQMQLKCELSRSVAELLKNAAGHGQATEVIKRLFFETLQDTGLQSNNVVHPEPTSHPVIPSSIRSGHPSPKLQTRIVIPEPHLAPSPSRTSKEISRKRPLSTLSLTSLQTHHSYLLNPDVTEEQNSNKTKLELLQSVENGSNRSSMSEQQSRRPSPPNSTFESVTGTRALSLAESTSGRSASGTSSVLGSLSMSNIHSGPFLKDQNVYEDGLRDSNGFRATSAPGVNGMYPVYFAPHPNLTPPHDLTQQVKMQDPNKPQPLHLPIPIERISAEFKAHHTRHQECSQKQDGTQLQHIILHSLEQQRLWLHPNHLYPLQISQGSNSLSHRSSLPSIAYIESAHAPMTQNRPGPSLEQVNILKSEVEVHPPQQTPQLSPQQGQQLDYMSSAPVSIPGNTYVPSHYFIPPPLQPGMVSWVPSAVAPDRRHEEEEPYSHKKRRGLKSGISFMISTPQNPPARKYNKLL